jgi:glycine cleavage system regulatory protein
MGLDLLARVVGHAAAKGEVPALRLSERLATKAPMIRRTISLTEEGHSVGTSLIVTAIGSDRPGIVSLLSERAQGFGANWAGSRMANLAGQFAGMVHFEVPAANAEPLAQALQALETSGLRVVIAKSETSPAPAGRRMVKLELAGLDRPGIVRDLSRSLAEQGVSIDDLHTEIVSDGASAEHRFKVKALLVVPESLPNETLRGALGTLANQMMVDIALGEHASA